MVPNDTFFLKTDCSFPNVLFEYILLSKTNAARATSENSHVKKACSREKNVYIAHLLQWVSHYLLTNWLLYSLRHFFTKIKKATTKTVSTAPCTQSTIRFIKLFDFYFLVLSHALFLLILKTQPSYSQPTNIQFTINICWHIKNWVLQQYIKFACEQRSSIILRKLKDKLTFLLLLGGPKKKTKNGAPNLH